MNVYTNQIIDKKNKWIDEWSNELLIYQAQDEITKSRMSYGHTATAVLQLLLRYFLNNKNVRNIP